LSGKYSAAHHHFLQVYLTSSEKVMGKYKNSFFAGILLYSLGVMVTLLNIALLVSILK
jgi:manganese transport protein